jgi:hypothetical protein
MTTSPKRCNFVAGSFFCRGAAYYEDADGPRCYSHRPEQLAHSQRKEAERARSDAERGIRRCGVTTLANRPCPRIAMQGGTTCPQHDPAQQAARAQASVDHYAAKKREHEVWAVKRKVELECGLAALQTRHNALIQDDMALRRSVRDLRVELAGLKRQRTDAAKQLDTVAAELLDLARAFVSSGTGAAFTAERCDLAIRYADALTNHARERRLAARPQTRGSDESPTTQDEVDRVFGRGRVALRPFHDPRDTD